MKILVATRSPDKLAEARRILSDVQGLEVVDLTAAGVAPSPEEEALEPWETFEENALSKARWFHARTGLPTVADDSGLEVEALGGAPGVRSKRFSPDRDLEGEARDRANNAYLLACLGDAPPVDRTARYVCVAALVEGTRRERTRERTFRGEAPGRILDAPRGDGGFGYDPLFYDLELERTFAEISREEKNARSHRGAAFRALARHLREVAV